MLGAVPRSCFRMKLVRRNPVSISAVVAVACVSTALAQYSYNPNAAHEQVPGIRYFGSAKSAQGDWVPGVTIVLASKTSTFVFFTDEQGRFSGSLPIGSTPDQVSAKCSKSGFQFVRVSKRPDTAVPPKAVQIDCLLRADSSKAH